MTHSSGPVITDEDTITILNSQRLINESFESTSIDFRILLEFDIFWMSVGHHIRLGDSPERFVQICLEQLEKVREGIRVGKGIDPHHADILQTTVPMVAKRAVSEEFGTRVEEILREKGIIPGNQEFEAA